MLGDAHDLHRMLKWAETIFWNENEEQVVFGLETRELVAQACIALCHAFDGVELAHRKEFRLTAKKAEKLGVCINEPIRDFFFNNSIANYCQLS